MGRNGIAGSHDCHEMVRSSEVSDSENGLSTDKAQVTTTSSSFDLYPFSSPKPPHYDSTPAFSTSFLQAWPPPCSRFIFNCNLATSTSPFSPDPATPYLRLSSLSITVLTALDPASSIPPPARFRPPRHSYTASPSTGGFSFGKAGPPT